MSNQVYYVTPLHTTLPPSLEPLIKELMKFKQKLVNINYSGTMWAMPPPPRYAKYAIIQLHKIGTIVLIHFPGLLAPSALNLPHPDHFNNTLGYTCLFMFLTKCLYGFKVF